MAIGKSDRNILPDRIEVHNVELHNLESRGFVNVYGFIERKRFAGGKTDGKSFYVRAEVFVDLRDFAGRVFIDRINRSFYRERVRRGKRFAVRRRLVNHGIRAVRVKFDSAAHIRFAVRKAYITLVRGIGLPARNDRKRTRHTERFAVLVRFLERVFFKRGARRLGGSIGRKREARRHRRKANEKRDNSFNRRFGFHISLFLDSSEGNISHKFVFENCE